jgi:rubredoxin
MIQKWLFWISYRLLQVTIISIVPFGLFAQAQGWNAALLGFTAVAISSIALLYLLAYRCSNCNQLIYSEENKEKLGYKPGFPLPYTKACPNCQAPTP